MTKKVIVFGATGRVGKAICQLALAEGWEVTAFVRNAEKMTIPNVKLAVGDVTNIDSIIKAFESDTFNAVLSAIGPRTIQAKIRTSSIGMVSITKAMAQFKIYRIVAVGGIGILQYSDNLLVQELHSFPPQLKTISDEHYKAWQTLIKSELAYTMVCPGYMPSGKQTGVYQTKVNESYPGISQITAEDVAHFMVSQIDNPAYYSQRIAIGY